MELPTKLTAALQPFDFKTVVATDPDIRLILKRQTWNTNRAMVLASLDERPDDFTTYLAGLRQRTAALCKYIPFLWEIGIQVIVLAPGLADIDPSKYVSLVNTQWELIQSMFLVDTQSGQCHWARTWGQVITGKYQDAIRGVLAEDFDVSP